MSGPGQTPDWQGCLPIYYVQITAIKVNILKNKPFFSLRLPGLFSLCVCAGKAYEPCKLSDLAVTQTINHHHKWQLPGDRSDSGEQVHMHAGRRETGVQEGFNSSLRVYPTGIVKPDGNGQCILNGGNSVSDGNAVNFYYCSTSQISISPVPSTIACSVASSGNGGH